MAVMSVSFVQKPDMRIKGVLVECLWISVLMVLIGFMVYLLFRVVVLVTPTAAAYTVTARIVTATPLVEPVHDNSVNNAIISRTEIRNIIEQYAGEYGVDYDVALRIADCESSLNPRAQNPKGTAKGLYQFTDSTWKFIKAQGHQFDIDENVKNFMIWYPVHPGWWECR